MRRLRKSSFSSREQKGNNREPTLSPAMKNNNRKRNSIWGNLLKKMGSHLGCGLMSTSCHGSTKNSTEKYQEGDESVQNNEGNTRNAIKAENSMDAENATNASLYGVNLPYMRASSSSAPGEGIRCTPLGEDRRGEDEEEKGV